MLADNKSIVSAGGGQIRAGVEPGRCAGFSPGHQGPIFSVAVNPAGSQLFTASGGQVDQGLRREQRQRCSDARRSRGRGQGDGAHERLETKVVSGSDDNTFLCLECRRRQASLDDSQPGCERRRRLAAAANNTMAAAGLANGTVKIFNIAITDAEKAELASYQTANAAVVHSPSRLTSPAPGRRG